MATKYSLVEFGARPDLAVAWDRSCVEASFVICAGGLLWEADFDVGGRHRGIWRKDGNPFFVLAAKAGAVSGDLRFESASATFNYVFCIKKMFLVLEK